MTILLFSLLERFLCTITKKAVPDNNRRYVLYMYYFFVNTDKSSHQ